MTTHNSPKNIEELAKDIVSYLPENLDGDSPRKRIISAIENSVPSSALNHDEVIADTDKVLKTNHIALETMVNSTR